MKNIRTNLSINIQFNTVQEVEAVLYEILNELSGTATFGSKDYEKVSYNFVRETFTIEKLSDGNILKTFKSKI